MRKTASFVFLMLLAFCLCLTAGAQADDTFSSRAASPFQLNLSARSPYYIDSDNGDWCVLGVSIANYNQIASQYTSAPVFEIEQTGGMAFAWYRGGDDPSWIPIVRNETIQNEGTATFRVVCTWDNDRVERNVTIEFARMPSGLPTGLNGLPKQITVKTGELVDYYSNLSIVPASWAVPQGAQSSIDCYAHYYGSHRMADDALYFNDWLQSGFVGNIGTYTAGEPGRYQLEVNLWINNVCISEEVDLFITDEDGNIPKEKMQLGIRSNGVYYIDSMNGASNVFTVAIENYSQLLGDHNGIPEFKVKQTGGVPFKWSTDSYETQSIMVIRDEAIQQEGSASFQIECTWDGDTAKYDATINFARLPGGLPTGINGIPKQITVKTGEQVDYLGNLSFSPAGWTLPQGVWSYINCSAYYYGTNDWTGNALKESGWANANPVNEYMQYTAGEPGHYTMQVSLWLRNLCIDEEVDLIITDKDGNVPKDGIRLSVDTKNAYYIDDDSGDHGVFGVYIDNYNQLVGQYTGTPAFKVTQIDGITFDWEQDSYNPDSVAVVRNEMIKSEGTATFHVVCTWGNDRVERDVTVNFAHMPGGVPTGINGLPLQLVVKTGEQISCFNNLSISPAGWTVPQGAWSYFNCECFSANGWVGGVLLNPQWHSGGIANGFLTYTAGAPGHYRMMVQLWVNNLSFPTYVDLIITDKDGNYPEAALPTIAANKTLVLPAGTRKIEDEAFCGGSYEAVVLPNGLQSIGSGAFADSAVRVITIPSSVTSIAPNAFENAWIAGIICDRNSYAAEYAIRNGFMVKYR